MKNKILSICCLLQLLASPAFAKSEGLFLGAPRASEVVVNNRVLANINGKAITVIDVMKKLDMIFYKQYPQFSEIAEARFQFYQASWKQVLNDLIDKELILADAIEHKLPVTNGDIRQEIEELFGPNIHANLDKAGITYEEAWEILKGELLLKRMMYVRVNSQVLKKVTPYVVRSYYEEWAKKNQKDTSWNYHMITFRADDSCNSAEAANYAHYLLTEKKIPVEKLSEELKSKGLLSPGITVNVSPEYRHKEKDIAPQNKEIVCKLGANESSLPLAQKSRDNTMVFRIYHVNTFEPGGAPQFNVVEKKLKDELLDKQMVKDGEEYLKKLRRHYHLSEQVMKDMIPDDFQPFVLR